MPRVITEQHQWVVASILDVDDKQARWANRRETLTLPGPIKIDALEVFCAMCRKGYDDVADQPCAAAIDNRHLIGGDPHGHRASRKGRTAVGE